MLRFKCKDILEALKHGEVSYIAHGCNCRARMGKGFARMVKDLFPEAYLADINKQKGYRNCTKSLVGSYSLAKCSVNEYNSTWLKDNNSLTIINLYTQDNISYGTDVFEYQAFDDLLTLIFREVLWLQGDVLSIPLIGAGNAKGNLSRILEILNKHKDKHIDVYIPNKDMFTLVTAKMAKINHD